MTRVNSRSEVAWLNSEDAAKSRSAAAQTASTCCASCSPSGVSTYSPCSRISNSSPKCRRSRDSDALAAGWSRQAARRARDATLPDKLAQRDKQVEVQVREVGDGRHLLLIQRPPRTARKSRHMSIKKKVAAGALPATNGPEPTSSVTGQ